MYTFKHFVFVSLKMYSNKKICLIIILKEGSEYRIGQRGKLVSLSSVAKNIAE